MRSTAETRRRLEQARLWTNNTELLAMLVEVVSVLASEQRLGKPIDVPRPEWLRSGAASRRGGRDGYARAANVMKANAAGRVRVSG